MQEKKVVVNRFRLAYGGAGNFHANGNKRVEVPAVELEDYLPESVAGKPQLGPEAIERLRVHMEILRSMQAKDWREMEPMMFAESKTYLSAECIVLISKHPKYVEAELAKDPFVLWDIIDATHLANQNGNEPNMKMFCLDKGTKETKQADIGSVKISPHNSSGHDFALLKGSIYPGRVTTVNAYGASPSP